MCGAKSVCVRARMLITRVILLCFFCVWHGDKGEVTVGLVTALGCRLWSVAGDVLFDQLSRGFRQEEVNVHRLSGRTPLGEPIALCLPVYFHR